MWWFHYLNLKILQASARMLTNDRYTHTLRIFYYILHVIRGVMVTRMWRFWTWEIRPPLPPPPPSPLPGFRVRPEKGKYWRGEILVCARELINQFSRPYFKIGFRKPWHSSVLLFLYFYLIFRNCLALKRVLFAFFLTLSRITLPPPSSSLLPAFERAIR